MSVIRKHYFSLGGSDGVYLGENEGVIKTILSDEFYIKWRSIDGYKHVRPDDTVFDDSKVMVWLENFPTQKILKSIYAKKKKVFLLKELDLKLKLGEEYTGLNTYFTLKIRHIKRVCEPKRRTRKQS